MQPDAPSESAADREFNAVRFFTESTALVSQSTTGESGLVGVRQVADIALWVLDATGIVFVEFGPAVGRVIAAAGEGRNALGRRVESGDQRVRSLLATAGVRGGSLASLPVDLRIGNSEAFMFSRVMLGSRPAG